MRFAVRPDARNAVPDALQGQPESDVCEHELNNRAEDK